MDLEASTRTFVTLAFMDLSGSTGFANMLDPDVYGALLERLHDCVATAVRSHDGVVSQIYGDGLLAIFRGEGSGMRALASTLAVHEATRELPVPAGVPALRLEMHSGIHGGLVLLRPGDIERGRIETVGRPTGVAARLAAAAKPGEILVSQGTLGPMGAGLRLGPVRHVAVSGASDLIPAVPVLGMSPSATRLHEPYARRTPFLGRRECVDHIASGLLARDRAAPLSIAVVGPAGQGKSRLSEEIELRAKGEGAAVLRGAAALSESASTLQPFREIDAAAAALLGEATYKPPGSDLARLPEAITGRLRQLARHRPTLLILDDWQWADSASLQLLDGLRRSGVILAILLLSRETSPGELPLGADEIVELPPVDSEAAAALIQHLRPELDDLDSRRVARLAGGNPLYLEELCLLSTRALSALLAADASQDEIGRVAAIIEARVSPLPPDLAEVLQAAAVVGVDCSLWLLARLCGTAAPSPVLDRLRELDLLIPALTPGSVRFKHAVIQNVVYQLIPLDQRRILHGRVAELIAAHDPGPGTDRDEMLAWHYSQSGEPARAVLHAERAGDLAVAAASVDRAQLQYRRALQALDRLPAEESYQDRLRLVGKYGLACVYDCDSNQLGEFERACAVAHQTGDRDGEAMARFWYGYICHGSGQARRAVNAIGRALALSTADAESPFGVQLRATLGQSLAAAGRYAAAIPLLDSAIDVKRRHRSGQHVSAGTTYSLALRSAILADTGHFAQAHAAIAEARELLGGRPHPVEGSVMGWGAAVHYWQSDWEGLLAIAERGCRVAVRIETVYIHAISRAFASYARWRLDGREEAASELANAIACLVDRGKHLALSIAYGCLADIEAARGNELAVRAAVGQAYARARQGEPFGMAAAARALARIVAPDRPYQARRLLAHARGNARRRRSPHELAKCDLEEAALGLIPAEVVPARLVAAAAAFERMEMPGELRRTRALIAQRGEV
ncbi:MAG: AAA family ATPase [Rhizorhabdus sp.]